MVPTMGLLKSNGVDSWHVWMVDLDRCTLCWPASQLCSAWTANTNSCLLMRFSLALTAPSNQSHLARMTLTVAGERAGRRRTWSTAPRRSRRRRRRWRGSPRSWRGSAPTSAWEPWVHGVCVSDFLWLSSHGRKKIAFWESLSLILAGIWLPSYVKMRHGEGGCFFVFAGKSTGNNMFHCIAGFLWTN